MRKFKIFSVFIISLLSLWIFAQSKGVLIKSDPRIDRLMELRISTNSQGRTVDGYVIQIFYGRSESARAKLDEFALAYPEIKAVIEYDNPDYKVFVGAFQTREEADMLLKNLKQNPKYSGAFIRPKSIVVY